MATLAAEDLTALVDSLTRLLADHSAESDVRRTMETPEGYDPALWAQLSEMGVAGLLVDEAHGGAGAGPVEIERVMEAAGAVLLCSPLLASGVLAAGLIQALGDADAKSRLLPEIADGSKIVTVALTGEAGGWTEADVALTADADGRLSGVASFVLNGQSADVILAAAKGPDGLAVYELAPNAAGLTIKALPTFDHTLRLAHMSFDGAPARRLVGSAWAAVETALDLARVALAGDQAGGARRTLEFTVDYAKTRVQFGRSIGSFQAVKHMASELLLESESATSAARHAAQALASGAEDAPAAVALAAFACADAYSQVTATAVQMHGGIAFTWAHPAHLYLRRARADAQLFGTAAVYRERYLQALGSLMMAVTDKDLQAEVKAWLADNWKGLPKPQPGPGGAGWTVSPEQKAWLAKVVDARWAVPRWPEQWYGRGLPDAQARIVEREFAALGAPGTGQDRTNLWANTALAYATPSFKAKIVPQLLKNETAMCLLYSEPGAGSDLAGIRTRADHQGDHYVVNGQKVWTSGAATADYGMLIARTDWDVPKHRGISFFFLPMKQPGVEVRPLRQITDESHFNEVFITDAICPEENLLGPLNAGWGVLQTALAYERSVMGDGARGPRSGAAESRTEEPLIALARETGAIKDPVIRQEIAKAIAYKRLNALNNARAKADLAQGTSSPIMSLGKLAMSRILHEEARVRTMILGAGSMLEGKDYPRAEDANFLTLNAYFTSIGGGTDQIQKNIIGERVLGLPKEPEVDRDVPFREVKGNVAR